MVDFTYGLRANFDGNIQPGQQPIQPPPSLNKALEIANSETVFKPPKVILNFLKNISADIKDVKENFEEDFKDYDLTKGFINFINFLSGSAVGALTGLAIVGLTTSPLGWGLAVGALIFTLAAAARHGGIKDLLHSLKYAWAGFLFGGGLAVVGGITSTLPAGMSASESGTGGYVVAGIATFMVGEWIALVCCFYDTGVLDEKLKERQERQI